VCTQGEVHIKDKRVTTGRISRRKHDDGFKRELVERSLQPGASVAAIAQANGINANLLFNWRRLYLRRGASALATTSPTPTLLPVTVEGHVATACNPAAAPSRAPSGVIEIDIGSARVRVRGVVDEATVRSVLQALGNAA
jgi:transposase